MKKLPKPLLVKDWDEVSERDRATEAQVQEFFEPFVHRSQERADKTIRLLHNPVCHAAISLDFTKPAGIPPFVTCKLHVNETHRFCTVHGGPRKSKNSLMSRLKIVRRQTVDAWSRSK
jgi:hypothetical protein